MPKRRGGRQSKSKNTLGGSSSNFGRFKTNNKKKKSKGKSNNHRGSNSINNNFPELMDLEENLFLPSRENSMKKLSKRPERLIDEVNFTRSHQDETFNRALRHRPIEFIKAKEVYDPNAKLKEKLPLSEIPKKHQDLLDVMNSPIQEDMDLPRSPDLQFLFEDEEDGDEQEEKELTEEEVEKGDDEDKIEEEEKEREETEGEETEGEETEGEETEGEEAEVEETEGEEDEEEPTDFMIDCQGDVNISRKFKPNKFPSQALLNGTKQDSFPDNSNLEFNSVLNIGKVSLHTTKDDQGQINTELLSVASIKRATQKGFINEEEKQDEEISDISDNDMGAYKDYISQIMKRIDEDDSDVYASETNFDIMASSTEEEEEEEEDGDSEKNVSEKNEDSLGDPDYGFVSEDYEFDVSQITVSNIRFGIENQFYTKCLGLTGSVEEFMWVNESDLFDYVLSKGVKEHRYKSFLKYVTNGLIDDHQNQPDYSDVYISESSDEESVTNYDDEDLDAMVAFTQSHIGKFSRDDIIPTESIKTKGKGRNKKLDLDRLSMEDDIRQSLQEQYQNHRQTKKDKKKGKEEAKFEAGVKKHDLLIIYPYSMHIKDIRSEFELFLQDTTRDTLNFPPLDSHGNKTVIKMANSYNMRSSKCGTGLKSFIKVVKNRKTFHYLPNYGQIGTFLKQRPIFNRTDQKRPKDEIIKTDGNLAKDKSRGRSKPKNNALVQEGDIVGATAPEIDKSNIGRQLLEKLGWVKGEGLGADGNKGISEPVFATVKKTKLGLK